MKENRILKFTGLVMFISAVALILLAETYAKYTSSASDSSTATVAKWSILLNSEDITSGSPESLEFNLFDTIYDSDSETLEENVAPGKIAPGTRGTFSFDLQNDSEVKAEYTIKLALTNGNNEEITLPLQFSLDGTTWGDLADLSGVLDMNNPETTEVHEGLETATVEWKWAYENNNDVNDTELGIDASNVKVKATIVVSQVD